MANIQFKSAVLKDFNPKDYHFFGLWKQNLFSACFWASCWNKEIADKLGIKSSESGALVLTQGNFFIKNSEIESIEKQIDIHKNIKLQKAKEEGNIELAGYYEKEIKRLEEQLKEKEKNYCREAKD